MRAYTRQTDQGSPIILTLRGSRVTALLASGGCRLGCRGGWAPTFALPYIQTLHQGATEAGRGRGDLLSGGGHGEDRGEVRWEVNTRLSLRLRRIGSHHSPHISAKVRTHPSLVLKLYSGGGDRPSARHLYSDLPHDSMPSSAGGAAAAQTQCRSASTPRR
eukprot:scaffold61579_cov49-Phaeocystis_antarctica.AAC.1